MSAFLPAAFQDVPIIECRPHVSEIMALHRDVPLRFAKSARAMKETSALKQVEAITDEFYRDGKLAILCGPPGNGKSFAAYAMAVMGYLRFGQNFSGYQSQTLFQMAWTDCDKAEYNDAWDRRGALIIDDFGAEAESKSGSLEANLYEGLNHRYTECLPTIITTNFKAEALPGLYPQFAARLESRFKEWAIVLKVTEPDMRAAAQGEADGKS